MIKKEKDSIMSNDQVKVVTESSISTQDQTNMLVNDHLVQVAYVDEDDCSRFDEQPIATNHNKINPQTNRFIKHSNDKIELNYIDEKIIYI
jgi:hypothetical protein